MSNQILVPDVGEADEVSVIEILVHVGDVVSVDDSLIVLESEKASMEIPSPFAGRVSSIIIKEGDEVEEGDLLLELEGSEQETTSDEAPEPEAPVRETDTIQVAEQSSTPASLTSEVPTEQVVLVPDVGEAKDVVVTEILVSVGDTLAIEDSILVLESEKASMEIPTPMAGEVQAVLVAEGAEVDEGDELIRLVVSGSSDQAVSNSTGAASTETAPATTSEVSELETAAESLSAPAPAPAPEKVRADASISDRDTDTALVYAGPAVRKQARELGVELDQVEGSGRQGRVVKEDIQAYVKQRLTSSSDVEGGSGIPAIPETDFTRWGEVEDVPMPRIRQFSARNLHRSWLNIPHVTQFDEADVTELEAFRKEPNSQLAAEGKKLTPLAFIVRACVSALKEYPRFNASIKADFSALTIKRYINIGIAVETDDGLMVPVIKDADQMGVVELAEACGELANAARDRKLTMDAMQGATFTISSLGGIGGTAFTPIVNAPEVAILGASRTSVSPQWNGESFVPRTMLPLSLSYDHRAIDGAEAARFTRYLSEVLTDIRRLIL